MSHYQFLNDEIWWKHCKEIEAAFTKLGKYLPPITLEEVEQIKLTHVIVHDHPEDFTIAKPVYVIVSGCELGHNIWIRIDNENTPSHSG